MPTRAETLARKYAGKIVKVYLNPDHSSPLHMGSADWYEAKVVGWRDTDNNGNEYVVVSALPPLRSKYDANELSRGGAFHWTSGPPAYAQRVYPEDVDWDYEQAVAPKPAPKKMLEFPHTCRDCKQPCLMMGNLIDCSNPNCKHKYKSKSALDLFAF